MRKGAIPMLVLSLVFTLITVFILAFATAFCVTSLNAFYHADSAADVVGGIFLFIALIPICIALFISGGCILPFNLVMILKMKIKTWYTYAILTFAIISMALAVIYVVALPLATASDAARNAISSSRSI